MVAGRLRSCLRSIAWGFGVRLSGRVVMECREAGLDRIEETTLFPGFALLVAALVD